MFNTIKKLFGIVPQYLLSAFQNEIDTRDILYTQVAKTKLEAVPVYAYIEVPNFSKMQRLEQMSLGTCVVHALEFTRRMDDGIIHSRRVPYVMTRNALKWDDSKPQGLPAREAAKTFTIVGTPRDTGLDDNTLTHAKYCGLTITAVMRSDANIYRFGGFAFPVKSVAGIKQALSDGKAVVVTIAIDWARIDKDGTVGSPWSISGFHEVVIGIADDEKHRFQFANWWGKSWGTNGDGFIQYSDLENVVFDTLAFAVIPEDLKERAKLTTFIFTQDLERGSNLAANIQLQRRLRNYGLFDGEEDRNFGPKTMQAVKDYQRFKALPETGFVGPLTRAALNADNGNGLKSKLDLWIEAITQMEGAKPENHNPGNIRYIGQSNVIGYTKNGFCIFKDDATGYQALRDLLVRAASGGSTLYKASGSLYDFYNVYAPSSDGNTPRHYAEFVAKHIGVDANVPISSLILI